MRRSRSRIRDDEEIIIMKYVTATEFKRASQTWWQECFGTMFGSPCPRASEEWHFLIDLMVVSKTKMRFACFLYSVVAVTQAFAPTSGCRKQAVHVSSSSAPAQQREVRRASQS